MITKNQIKLFTSLEVKKHRDEERLFIVEGVKMVTELLHSETKAVTIYCTDDIGAKIPTELLAKCPQVIFTQEEQIKKISKLKTPQGIVALAEIPQGKFIESSIEDKLTLCLDDIQDPGNLGTIIRLADWFGIDTILCSQNTADCYNPKVVQASMGAIFRVEIHYMDMMHYLQKELIMGRFPIYGALLDGEDIYDKALLNHGLIVLGNESKGISTLIKPLITDKIRIPHFPPDRQNSESLNVGTAAAIICAEFRRRSL